MSQNFDFIGGHYVQGITEDEVMIGVPFTERKRRLNANTVALITYNHPNRDLGDYLTEQLPEMETRIHTVGDASGTNGIQAAIHQAANLIRSL